jgi:hypothetical protein
MKLQKLDFRIRDMASQVLYKLQTAHRDPDFEYNTVQYDFNEEQCKAYCLWYSERINKTIYLLYI